MPFATPFTSTTLRISNWEEFNQYCQLRDGWAFRGQSQADWPLLTSLSRKLLTMGLPVTVWAEREERAIRVFRRKAHVYLRDSLVLQDPLRCLAMMQHHGAPTRLLDFTKSPFVAAFFALEQSTSDAAVFALNTPRLWSLAPPEHPTLDRDALDPRLSDHFNRYFASNRLQVVWFGEPSEMDRRLVAQSGLLVMPGVLDQPLDRVLSAYASSEPLMEKVVLSHAMRQTAMHALYRMNITQATLFPDLEGLARSMSYELEEVWPQLVCGQDTINPPPVSAGRQALQGH